MERVILNRAYRERGRALMEKLFTSQAMNTIYCMIPAHGSITWAPECIHMTVSVKSEVHLGITYLCVHSVPHRCLLCRAKTFQTSRLHHISLLIHITICLAVVPLGHRNRSARGFVAVPHSSKGSLQAFVRGKRPWPKYQGRKDRCCPTWKVYGTCCWTSVCLLGT